MNNKKTRIILSSSLLGKTELDKRYKNAYDYDKHSLEHKYDRTGFENLTDEEFKSLPNRVIKENWAQELNEGLMRVVDSGDYDVVTGWLLDDTVEALIEAGYPVELVLVKLNENNEPVLKQRSIDRGNNELFWGRVRPYFEATYNKYKDDKRMTIHVIDDSTYLSELITKTGTELFE